VPGAKATWGWCCTAAHGERRRQVLRFDERSGRENRRALDDVLQLPNVAGQAYCSIIRMAWWSTPAIDF